MMTKLAEQILEQAKALSADEREELANQIIDSVADDPEYLAEWEEEIERRLKDHLSGKTKTLTMEEYLVQLRQSGETDAKAG